MKLWIARDKDNSLNAFFNEPELDFECDEWCSDDSFQIDSRLFPEVTFENSPQLVEIKLVKEE